MREAGHKVSDLPSSVLLYQFKMTHPQASVTGQKCTVCQLFPVLQSKGAVYTCGQLTANIAVLEDYPQGYPRLAAFLALDRDFTVFKRFDYLHMRSLLEQQDELAELQELLHRCDDVEPIPLGLSSRRQDENPERRGLLRQVTAKLQVYDQCVQNCHAMLRLPEAHKTQKQNVKNWYMGNKPLVRSESGCYMNCTCGHDYIALTAKDTDKGRSGDARGYHDESISQRCEACEPTHKNVAAVRWLILSTHSSSTQR